MKITNLLVATLAFTTAAFAQDNAPPPAAAVPVDPAQLALAREVIAAMHAEKMFDGMTAQMKQMAAQAAGSAMPAGATAEQRQKVEELQEKITELSMDAAKGMISQMDRIYAEVYSEVELKAMKVFFSSPEGQSMLAKQPQVMQHIMPLVQQMQRDLMPKIQQLVADAKTEAEKSAAVPPPIAPPATSK